MNRRKFAKTVLGGLGASALASQAVYAAERTSKPGFEAGHRMHTADGLVMTLSGHHLPTSTQDEKQFVLTFDVHNGTQNLEEKIYQLTDHKGVKHQIYMTPVDKNQLQAVFNWRTHA